MPYLGVKPAAITSATEAEIAGDLTVDTDTLHVDSTNNNVGIGTTTPSNFGGTTLQTNHGSTYSANLVSSGTYILQMIASQTHSAMSIGARSNHHVAFTTNDTERMRIESGGNLLIGATSRSNVERVNISYPRTTHCGMVIDCTDSTAATAAIKFFNPNGDVGSIDMSGSSTSYNTSSDYRLKQGVEDMAGAIDRVKALAPKRFQFIADADTTVDGFLAHEAQAVVPEAVTGTKDEVDEDGNPVMQGIDQAKLVPLLTAALKESIAKIETLETEMTALKARVTALEDA